MHKKTIGLVIGCLIITALTLPAIGMNEKSRLFNKTFENNIIASNSGFQNNRITQTQHFSGIALDLIVTNANTSSIAILEGLGNGDFNFLGTESVGLWPLALAHGDFNNDGLLDVATTNMDSNTVTVLLGDGIGGFSSDDFSVGFYPFGIVTEDFNHDGNLDIAAGNNYDGTVSVLLGDGTGNFGPQQTYALGSYPTDLTVGDFNKDGNMDLIATSDYGNYIVVLLGDGNGGFTYSGTYLLGSNYDSYAITNADFNDDTNLDIAVGSGYYSYVGVLFGDGNGGFGAIQNYVVGYGLERFDLVAEDFNMDGALDIAIPNTDENTISVLLGDGSGGFNPHQIYPSGVYPVGITDGDFNGDGNKDLAVTNAFSNTISVYLGDGSGGFTPLPGIYGGEIPVGIVSGEFIRFPEPNLNCNGALSWIDVKPGETVSGDFEVENIGEAGSLLDWAILEWPEWGNWTFTPTAGSGLTPEAGAVTVAVEVEAPNEKNQEFTGKIKAVNTLNTSDFCEIDIVLKTPITHTYHHSLLELIFTLFPNLFLLLKMFLGL